MISADEIKKVARGWWKDVLCDHINSQNYFPKRIDRIGKIQASKVLAQFHQYQTEVETLVRASITHQKKGFEVIFEEANFRSVGKQKTPVAIIIKTIDDYLFVTGYRNDFRLFQEQTRLLLEELPQLKDWALKNPLKLVDKQDWKNLILVCKYFLQSPKPNLYIRQLPIEIPTKFIEENQSQVQSLLEFLIPEHINVDEKEFEKRFNLKFDEPLIRVRFLDKSLSPSESAFDLSFRISELKASIPFCENVLITENKMNFLTLPELKNTIALWSGGGFNVSYLKGIEWLREKNIYYWGDIDTHGFWILNQLKNYFRHTTALMMDVKTLNEFKQYHGEGGDTKEYALKYLLEDELSLYSILKDKTLRLEQEKIPQVYSERILNETIVKKTQTTNHSFR